VCRLRVSHQPGDVCHRDRRLLDEQLRGGLHATSSQILAEGGLAELAVHALELARRAAQRGRQPLQRQVAAVVGRDCVPSQPVQAASMFEGGSAHTPFSDGRAGV